MTKILQIVSPAGFDFGVANKFYHEGEFSIMESGNMRINCSLQAQVLPIVRQMDI
jgi:hypothetical protein